MLYLVTDTETGSRKLVEAKRTDTALARAIASRFTSVAVSTREAYDLGAEGVTLLDDEQTEEQDAAAVALPPADTAAEQGEAGEGVAPVSPDSDQESGSGDVDGLQRDAELATEERPSSDDAGVTAGETATTDGDIKVNESAEWTGEVHVFTTDANDPNAPIVETVEKRPLFERQRDNFAQANSEGVSANA